jgi:molecular chaperone GrpE
LSEDLKVEQPEALDDGGAGSDGLQTPATGSSGSEEPAGGSAVDHAPVLDLEARAAADPRTRAELIAGLDGVEAQRDEYLDDLRRSHAEFENYRKRVARDGSVQREHGRTDVITALLDVLDDLDRVVAAADGLDTDGLPPAAAAVASGIRVAAEKAQRALETFGVERVDAIGVPFDPTVHDAVQQVEGVDADVDGPTVHAVLRPGYRQPDRILRPAMVVVAQ